MATTRAAPRHRWAVLGALMLAAFTFNTAENLPVGLLELIAASLRVPVSAVGLLVTGYAVTAAVGLFAPGVRGRVIGALSVAGSLALVLGVPAGTWLGQHSDWPVPVAVLAGLGLGCLVTIVRLLPTTRPEEEHAAYGSSPDVRRFGTVLAAGTLSATGAFAGYTYIVKFLGDVSGFAIDTVSGLLVVFGVACLAGVSIMGALLDRFPHSALPTAVATQAVGMLGLYTAGSRPMAAVVFLVLVGGALGPVFMTTQNEMLHCAPGRTDIALAANSWACNAGIAAGAALGGLVLHLADVRATFLA